MARIIFIKCLLLISSFYSISAYTDYGSISENFQDSMKKDSSNDEYIPYPTRNDEKSKDVDRGDEKRKISGSTTKDVDYGGGGDAQEAPMGARQPGAGYGPQSINRHYADQYNRHATGLTMASAFTIIALFGFVLLVAFLAVNMLMDDPVPYVDEWGEQRKMGREARYRSRSRTNFYNA